jgi:hypothetical protein
MKFSTVFGAALTTAAVNAHCKCPFSIVPSDILTRADTFPALTGTSDWSVVRTTSNFQNNGPVTDVSSSQVRCYELNPGKGAPNTQSVAAGSSVTFKVAPNLYHPGPLLFYMAKVPVGKTAKDWDGSGNVWFKIYEEKSTVANGGLAWGSLSESLSIPQLVILMSNTPQTKPPPLSPSPARCRRASTFCAWSTLPCTQPAASTVPSCTSRAHSFPSLAEAADHRARSSRSRARTRPRTPVSGSTFTVRLGTRLLVRLCGLVRGIGVDEGGDRCQRCSTKDICTLHRFNVYIRIPKISLAWVFPSKQRTKRYFGGFYLPVTVLNRPGKS